MTVRVLAGDCREILPTIEHADVVITDPVWPNCPPGLLDGSDRPCALLREALELIPETVKRLVIVLRSDSDPRFLQAVPDRWPFFNAHWLQYVMPGYMGRKLGGNEIAYAFGDPVPSREGRRVIPSVAPKSQPGDRPRVGHPCSRSLAHMVWLVKWWSDPGETILDPFAGSGTVGVASERMFDRHAILIEISEEYAEMAEGRIREDAPLFANVEAL